MTLETRLIQTGWFDVGLGTGASAQYPILSGVEAHEIQGDDGDNTPSLLRTTLSFESLTLIAGAETINDVMIRLRTELARRGDRVRLNELNGTARIFDAGGVTGGALRGYPRVNVESVADGSVPPVQFFRVKIETIEPVAASLPRHTFDRTRTTDTAGLVTLAQRGQVRTDGQSDALAYVTANVLDPARIAAQGLGRLFSSSTKTSLDPSIVEYNFTDAPPGAVDFGADITNGQVRDDTRQERVGRITRTISGFAVGPDAMQFAMDQDPSSPTTFVASKNISLPETPSGRVNFRYEALTGAAVTAFPGLTVFDWTQNVNQVSGGRAIQAASYDSAAPQLWLGPEAPYVYRESSTLVFRGAWSAADIPLSMDGNRLAAQPQINCRSRSGGVNEITVQRVYMFESAQSLPDPVEVSAL